jgi:membrane-associated PAP2 superfamily phosphatase
MPAFETAELSEAQGEALMLLSTRDGMWAGALLCLAAVLVFALGRFTDVDLVLADAFYDGATGSFPWRDAWLTDIVGHRILKAVLVALALLLIAAAMRGAIWPETMSPLRRLQLQVIACSAVVVPLVISLLKQHSNAHCPWDVTRYGGSEPYVRLFAMLPPGAHPGHCLPAAHASSALWLISLAVLWLPGQRRKAWRAACAAAGLGLMVGWLQQMRGAHFLTHTLWSVCIACGIVLTLVMLLQALRVEQPRGCASW